jgi:hypothetical protein
VTPAARSEREVRRLKEVRRRAGAFDVARGRVAGGDRRPALAPREPPRRMIAEIEAVRVDDVDAGLEVEHDVPPRRQVARVAVAGEDEAVAPSAPSQAVGRVAAPHGGVGAAAPAPVAAAERLGLVRVARQGQAIGALEGRARPSRDFRSSTEWRQTMPAPGPERTCRSRRNARSGSRSGAPTGWPGLS